MPLIKTAILVSHGQPSDPEPQEQALQNKAQEVEAHMPGWRVQSATLASPGRLETLMEDGAVIYPFFMARGWFTAKVLPERLRGWTYRLACPFGLDPDLPELAAKAVLEAQQSAGWEQAQINLLLAAHGSARGPKAAEAAESFAERLRNHLTGASIRPAYVEQSPSIEDVARGMPDNSLCLPFFAQSGDHVREDIPEALSAARYKGIVMPVLGAGTGSASMIAHAIAQTAKGLAQ